MVLGYDEDRPKEENYVDFMEKLTSGLKELNLPNVALMIYGSYVRKDYNLGRSDIDSVWIFNDNIIINKENLLSCSEILAYALAGNNVPFQVTVSDLRTMQDGTFNSYNSSFKDYFESEGKFLIGQNYLSQFTYAEYKHPEQNPLAFNLRKIRNGLLFSNHYLKKDKKTFVEKFNSSLNSTSRASKQIMFMYDDKLRVNRFSAVEAIATEFPEVDVGPLKKIKYLFNNLLELDKMYHDTPGMLELYCDSLTTFEQMVKAYLDRTPNS
ncbi:hypothetical protein HN385_01560 [archaeon]|jgi:hypothetical protein|nr:hypothetical protein [archaeon]MBT3451690.1 hypothetical protein [archaeon]MBT6869378.1 hypothetical protein [archaeon]MBT7192541.1 hypothetical protein [archaeon]MBT7380617.1 hypothetical protein [archaeon]